MTLLNCIKAMTCMFPYVLQQDRKPNITRYITLNYTWNQSYLLFIKYTQFVFIKSCRYKLERAPTLPSLSALSLLKTTEKALYKTPFTLSKAFQNKLRLYFYSLFLKTQSSFFLFLFASCPLWLLAELFDRWPCHIHPTVMQSEEK